MFKRLPIAYWVPLAVLAVVCWLILQEAFWGVIVGWLADQLAAVFHITAAKMIAAVATYVILGGVALAAVYAAYLIGVHERKAFPTGLQVDYSEYLSGCRVETAFNSVLKATFYRVLVRPPVGQVRTKCTGTLVDIMVPVDANRLVSLWSADRVPLTWATFAQSLPTSIDLDDDHGRFLDVFFIAETSQIGIATPGFMQPTSFIAEGISQKPGMYVFCVSIKDADARAQEVQIALQWSGKRDTSTTTRLHPPKPTSPLVARLQALRRPKRPEEKTPKTPLV